MRYLFALFAILLSTYVCFGQSNDEKEILSQLEKLRVAMLSDDEVVLDRLTSPLLSYGHSNGLIENKKAFIAAIMDNTANFTSINLSDVSITVSGTVAYVRHKLEGETLNKGQQAGKVSLGVFLVWQKNKMGDWLLLGRQAYKL